MTAYRHAVPATTTLDQFDAMNLPVTIHCATGKHDRCKTSLLAVDARSRSMRWADCKCECHQSAKVYPEPSPEVVRVIERVNARMRELHEQVMNSHDWDLRHQQDGLQEALAIMAEVLGLDPEVIA